MGSKEQEEFDRSEIDYMLNPLHLKAKLDAMVNEGVTEIGTLRLQAISLLLEARKLEEMTATRIAQEETVIVLERIDERLRYNQ